MASDPDELARTATAPAHASAPCEPVGAMLGRYRLERELGAGGMGMVHAAFDPDLERRVALKVLRSTAGGDDARQRLLREARAMARLAHPNVVVVHEVGSANGRDFVAMELIDGETLADWVRARPRSVRDLMAAFLAAGRGLAAAHRADLVHRDFKPHNVLRSRDGRILVTDFGLARSVADVADMAPMNPPIGANTPSALFGLTQTGSLLGTPAYMAPEQWSSRKIGPATDQFAYCVALWEALAGARPFSGSTIEELRTAIERGPDRLDAGKLPRRLRGILRRGLARDPDRRWPSMDALLAALVRAERRPYVAVALAGGGLAVLVAIGFTLGRGATAEVCDLALRDPAVVWAAEARDVLRAQTSERVAAVFDGDVLAWQQARTDACTAPPAVRHTRLHCLDGVLARFDAVRRAAALAPINGDSLAAQLIAPAVCLGDAPPRLPTALSPLAQEALAIRDRPVGQPFDRTRLAAALAQAAADPCARALLLLASTDDAKASRPRDSAEEAAQAAEVCGDDRTVADALTANLSIQVSAFMDVKQQSLLRRVEAAVARVAQPSLVAQLDMVRGKIALVTEQSDEAIRRFGDAVTGFGPRLPDLQIHAARSRIMLWVSRHRVDDLVQARVEIAIWLPRAEAAHLAQHAHQLATADAMARWFQGDVVAAHAALARLLASAPPDDDPDAPPDTPVDMRELHGVVVDAAGKPVAGATVVAGAVVLGDAVGVGVAFDVGFAMRFATTDAAGAYTLDQVAPTATVIAQLADRRSQPLVATRDRDRLVLGPTTRVRGKVVASGVAAESTMVVAISDAPGASPMYQQVAPVAADGTFELTGVLQGKVRIGALLQHGSAGQAFALQMIDAGPTGLDGVVLPIGAGRPLRVVVRSASSAPLSGAQVLIVPPKLVIKTVRDMLQVLHGGGMTVAPAHGWIGEPPAELTGKLAPGDLVATFTTAPIGEASLCAMGLSGDLSDPTLQDKLAKHSEELELTCQPLAADETVVTIDVPPMKRLD